MIPLPALDGANPLGFLAALGTLVVLEDRGVMARLAWRQEGAWRPALHGVDSLEQVVDHLYADLQTWADEPALALSYPDKKGEKTEHDLKPSPEHFASFLRGLRAQRKAHNGRGAELGCAFATDVAVDANGASKPTALHFTAGQQHFLSMVNELREGLTRDHLLLALQGPWTHASTLPVLGWDATTDRAYALRALDPSKCKPTGDPGADWLALQGLRLFPVVPRGSVAITTGVAGRWKTSDLTWPLWNAPLSRSVIASLLQQARFLTAQPRAILHTWGVETVLASRILRSDQGGYGSFTPARVVR